MKCYNNKCESATYKKLSNAQIKMRNDCLNSSLAEKDLGVTVDHKLKKISSRVLLQKKITLNLKCINESVVGEMWEVIILLYLSGVEPQLEYVSKTDRDKLGKVHKTTMGMIRGVENMSKD